MKIFVIGVGLIGGSMALDLKDLDPSNEIVGVDTNEAHLEEALSLGIIDQKGTLDSINQADRVILCIPVKDSMHLLPKLLNQLHENALLWDVGSTKEQLCKAVENHPKRALYLAAHPIAGTEFSGPKAAQKVYLLENHKYYVKPKPPVQIYCCGQKQLSDKWECTFVLWIHKNTTAIWRVFLTFRISVHLC